jgi:hypothetical protein
MKIGAADPRMNAPADRQALFGAQNTNTIGFKQGDKIAPVDTAKLELSDGTTLELKITEYDTNHYQQGHTVEQYSFQNQNINRAANSTFWPPGTSLDTIKLHAKVGVQQLRPELEAAIKAGTPNFVSKEVTVAGINYKIGVEVSTKRITQFYPQSGTGIVPVHKTELAAMKIALGK